MAHTQARTLPIAKIELPEITEVPAVLPDENNPRERDSERFDLLKESLRVAGHILPIHATREQLLSGHQRLDAAIELGATRVPVIWHEEESRLKRAGINILFNMAINDFSDPTRPGSNLEELRKHIDLISEMPSVDIDDPEQWPCQFPQEVQVSFLEAANPEIASLTEAGFEAAHALRVSHQICVPIVCTPAGKIINGKRRLAAAKYGNEKWWPCVILDVEESVGKALGSLLNHLSMNFDLRRYKETLKAGVWLNPFRQRQYLGRGFTYWVRGKENASGFDILNGSHAEEWKDVHGSYVVDFGAGHLTESALMNKAGIKTATFEPYFVPPKNEYPDLDKSRDLTERFLKEVQRGEDFTSVFACSVLNQVPFPEDRIYILVILAALAWPNGTTYISTLSDNETNWASHAKGTRRNQRVTIETKLPVDYQDKALLGGLLGLHPVVQCYMGKDELNALLKNFWRTVEVHEHDKILYARASRPKRVNPASLAKALWEEFELLPYHDGTTLGFGALAFQAFSQRLGIKLVPPG